MDSIDCFFDPKKDFCFDPGEKQEVKDDERHVLFRQQIAELEKENEDLRGKIEYFELIRMHQRLSSQAEALTHAIKQLVEQAQEVEKKIQQLQKEKGYQ